MESSTISKHGIQFYNFSFLIPTVGADGVLHGASRSTQRLSAGFKLNLLCLGRRVSGAFDAGLCCPQLCWRSAD